MVSFKTIERLAKRPTNYPKFSKGLLRAIYWDRLIGFGLGGAATGVLCFAQTESFFWSCVCFLLIQLTVPLSIFLAFRSSEPVRSLAWFFGLVDVQWLALQVAWSGTDPILMTLMGLLVLCNGTLIRGIIWPRSD
ncbi:MAG: hypothetical protein HOK97_24175 [Deltaproteobacteria bacterium]|jgi:hypothetical protein|nr:hypothetical protein [Deltaproteobacteria bacterium]